MKTEKNINLSASEGLKEKTQPNQPQVYRNQRDGRRLGFQSRKPNNQDKLGGSGGKHQMGGKRKEWARKPRSTRTVWRRQASPTEF